MRRVTRALPVLSWLLVLALAAVLFDELGHPVTSLARLAAYWGWVVVAPGLVLHRWLRPGERSWSAEVAWGAAVGLSAELMLRPLAIVTGWSGVFWLWPLAVLVGRRGDPRAPPPDVGGGTDEATTSGVGRHGRCPPARPLRRSGSSTCGRIRFLARAATTTRT